MRIANQYFRRPPWYCIGLLYICVIGLPYIYSQLVIYLYDWPAMMNIFVCLHIRLESSTPETLIYQVSDIISKFLSTGVDYCPNTSSKYKPKAHTILSWFLGEELSQYFQVSIPVPSNPYWVKC